LLSHKENLLNIGATIVPETISTVVYLKRNLLAIAAHKLSTQLLPRNPLRIPVYKSTGICGYISPYFSKYTANKRIL